ncbi:MAG: hypothetical protein HDS93_00220 [Bacteroidales bacterium]|nr:hypothetical protein [Bacteroidales bacterium]MBD5190271.1 hypothetical protein [Bacteroidales bacterium]MBD5208484.1 hypothetical protein [Bacteroidales bacterium]
MRHTFFSTALALFLPLTVVSGASAEKFTANFDSGSIPSQITVSEGDSNELHESCYRSVVTFKPWVVLNLGTNGNAAVSLSHSDAGLKEDNRMTLPALKVEGNDYVLRWRAISYNPDFPESYKVILSVDGQETTIYATEAESDFWIDRAVSLSDYNGKTVTVTFVCDSENGFMLAVDDIYFGPADTVNLSALDTTPRFVGQVETAPVTGTLFNSGKALSGSRIVLLDEKGSVIDSQSVGDNLKPGESMEFSLKLPVSLNNKSNYTVAAEVDGKNVELLSGTVFSSYFTRYPVIEKCTGMWCTNCPEGTILVEELKRTYGNQLITMENHVSSGGFGDILSNDAYWANLKFYAVPYFMLNRVRDTAYSNLSLLDKGLYKETPARIAVSELNVDDENGSVTVETEFAKDFDNSTDRYRIAYSLQADFHMPENDDDFRQTNGCTMNRHERFKYMSGKIPAHMMFYRHVTLTSEFDFAGIESSLPSSIKKGEKMTFSIPLERPGYASSLKDCTIVAYILDMETGEMQNATSHLLSKGLNEEKPEEPKDPNGDTSVSEAEMTFDVNVMASNGVVSVNGMPEGFVEIFDISGSKLSSFRLDASGFGSAQTNIANGILLVRVHADNMTKTIKTVMK